MLFIGMYYECTCCKKTAFKFTVHCKYISPVNREPNRGWHFDDKSTLRPPCLCSNCWPNPSVRAVVRLRATLAEEQ